MLCVGAAVWGGLATLAPSRWRLPFVAAAGAGVLVALALAASDPRTLANALIVSAGSASPPRWSLVDSRWVTPAES